MHIEWVVCSLMGGKFSIETTKFNTTRGYNASIDPCANFLDAYLLCVESKKDGLKEGDECSEEKERYKVCRKETKAES